MENIGNVASPQDDGASEKLVDDEKNGHNTGKGNNIEVKYVTPSSQNGDAKIDIDNLKSAFAGMGKEELMKFANDPFWVRTRWFLFILFWLLWAAMLVGAIAIIVMAPKCAAPAPREWWEQSPVYKVDVAAFSSDQNKGDLAGVTSKLDYLKSLGVKTVILSSVIKADDPESDGKDEFKSVSPKFGTWEDFKTLVSAAKEKGLHILLTFVPNHSSVENSLFKKSAAKEEPYTSYYVWAPSRRFDADDKPVPPNNWLSITGGSAWEWNKERKEFYLHQFDKKQADLNFRNKDVVKYITDVMKFWLDNGVSGFYLDKAQYLFEDEALRNDTFSRTAGGHTHDEYGFYEHVFTSNLNELVPLMKKWKEFASNSSGIISVGGEVSPQQKTNESLAQLEMHHHKFKLGFTAEDLEKTVLSTISSVTWPVWELQAEDIGQNEILQLTSLLLPGTAVVQAGQELGLLEGVPIMWDNSTGEAELNVISQQRSADSSYSMYHALIEARKSPSILYGTIKMSVYNNSVFAYTRLKSGNPGYLMVTNVGEEIVVDLRQLPSVPDELSVIVRTENLHESLPLKNKVESSSVSLPSKSVAVFSFVPKSED